MKNHRNLLLLFCSLALLGPGTVAGAAVDVLVQYRGDDFSGGAKDIYGTDVEGEKVNCIYARNTGKPATMQLEFTLNSVPATPLFLHLKGRDDDAAGKCRIAIELNGRTLFEGANEFSSEIFDTRKFALPTGALQAGTNRLVIANREPQGSLGQPPWFQVAAVAVAPENLLLQRDLRRYFHVRLPAEVRPFPEPLPPGQSPGFKFRGTKGWAWRPEQYLAEIPYLTKFKLNFLMNCYLSMFDIENQTDWFGGRANRWWEDLPPAKKAAYEQVVRECQQRSIEFCFSMNPNLGSTRVVNDDSPTSVDQLFKHYAWMQGLGVRWFNIALDDAAQGVNATTQARVVNEIFRRLRARDPEAQMIFCPTFYWGDGTAKNQMNLGLDQQPYLETLARELHPDVYVFWTGDDVVGSVTRKAAESFRRLSGHRLFLWDNYPVNDNTPTLHLGPVVGRDADLCEVIDGYLGNPHCKQNEINRLPLATCADYAYNPRAYDPLRSITQAIVLLGDTQPQREVLRDLVEAYPGMLLYGRKATSFNSVQDQFQRIVAGPLARPAALAYIEYLQRLSARLDREFPDRHAATKQTLNHDVELLRQKCRELYQ